MDNRDRDENLKDDDTEKSFKRGGTSSDSSWDNEPSRDQSGGMQSDKGSSSEIERERDRSVEREH